MEKIKISNFCEMEQNDLQNTNGGLIPCMWVALSLGIFVTVSVIYHLYNKYS